MNVMLEEDFKDMLKIFIEENVKFLLIGGLAVGLHGHPRVTKDMDLWVMADKENAIKVFRALAKFGAPMQNISVQDFEKEGTIYQIGVAPVRIDIVTSIAAVDFETAMLNAKIIETNELTIPMISLPDLIKNKKASGRHRDLDDVESLEKILERKS